tara:strand:- start:755 stop:1291 length:537 start_codon:yes stop_codon:yes gene_type:complete
MKHLFVLLVLVLIAGCVSPADDSAMSSLAPEEDTMEYESYVTVESSKGTFTIGLYKDTPISTTNFVKLVEQGFYDGLTFHRYEPGFVIQGGDPSGDGTGGSSETIALEVVGLSHSKGTIGMARSNDPNSASSQWFVNLADNTFLDEGYAVFGMVTEGMDVVEELRAGDTMTKVTVKGA